MALNMPVFYKRTASAIVFAAIMLVGLLTGHDSFLLLTIIVSILCLREYYKLLEKIDGTIAMPLWLAGAIYLINTGVIFWSSPVAFYSAHPQLDLVTKVIIPLSILGIATIIITSILAKQTMLRQYFHAVSGLFYITLPMIALQAMEMKDMVLPIALILMIWTNDTMAYLVGSFIGKTPFSPISPKKTWEGTGGGALLTMIGAMVYGYFSHKFRLVDWAVLGLCAAVAGTLGDLVESKLKRMADVKDSGNIMPGHGGALDRFDSLLLAAPFAGVYVMLFM